MQTDKKPNVFASEKQPVLIMNVELAPNLLKQLIFCENEPISEKCLAFCQENGLNLEISQILCENAMRNLQKVEETQENSHENCEILQKKRSLQEIYAEQRQMHSESQENRDFCRIFSNFSRTAQKPEKIPTFINKNSANIVENVTNRLYKSAFYRKKFEFY